MGGTWEKEYRRQICWGNCQTVYEAIVHSRLKKALEEIQNLILELLTLNGHWCKIGNPH